MGLETLELRLALASLASGATGNWFERSVEVPLDPSAGQQWIVQLSDDAVATHPSVAAVNDWLDPATARALGSTTIALHVVAGLGMPGQVLVQAATNDAARVEQALGSWDGIAAFNRNSAIDGGQAPNDPQYSNQIGLNNTAQQQVGVAGADIDAQLAWNITTGSPQVVVAVIDSGIDYKHRDLYQSVWLNQGEIPASIKAQLSDIDGDDAITLRDLNKRVNGNLAFGAVVTDSDASGYIDAGDLLSDARWNNRTDDDGSGLVDDLFGWNFVTNTNNPFDDHGHGTHVSGIVGATGNNGEGVTGVSWNASLLPLKFLDSNNSGQSASAIAAINYATKLRTLATQAANVRVVNASWGLAGGAGDSLMADAIRASGAAGILFVAGAGNGDLLGRGINTDDVPFYPAGYDVDNIISVAAVGPDDQLARFSNYGANSVDIAAPGVGILSTERGNAYGTRNGTSMATPFVSGTAALIFATQPEASIAEVRQALLAGADRLPQLTNVVAAGGRLNAFGALKADTFAPRGQLLATPNITATNSSAKELQVRFTDTNPIDVSSFDSEDLVVTRVGFGGTELPVSFVSVDIDTDGVTRVATYKLDAPAGGWTARDKGTYEVRLRSGQVRDITNVVSGAKVVGSFQVTISDADVYFVNSLADSVDTNPGDGLVKDSFGRATLRAAIMEANARAGTQTIVLPDGTYALSLTGGNEDLSRTGDLDITASVNIVGGGSGRTVIDGKALDRVFDIRNATTAVTMTDLTVRGGAASTGGATVATGGGLRNAGSLSLTRVYVSSNTAVTRGGGIHNLGSLNLLDVWVDSNQTTGTAPEGGGGIFNQGSADLNRTTVSNSKSTAGVTGTGGGGGIYNHADGRLSLVNSTISSNTATVGLGGGIFNLGLSSIVQSTIAKNKATASSAGGIYNGVASSALGVDYVGTVGQISAIGGSFAVDPNGKVYVADDDNNRILVFAADGSLERSWGSYGTADGQFKTPTGIAIDGLGRIVVADAGNYRVQIFDANGTFIRKFGSSGNNDNQFLFVADITAGDDGQIYVNDSFPTLKSKIKVFDSNGNYQRTITNPVTQPSTSVTSLDVDSDGWVYAVEGGFVTQVCLYDPAGFLFTTFGTAGAGVGLLDSPDSIVVSEATNQVFVGCDGKVVVFTRDGRFLYEFTRPAGGSFGSVNYLGVGGGGRIYVADSSHSDVAIFRSNVRGVRLGDTIVAGNGNNIIPDIEGQFESLGFNLIGFCDGPTTGFANGVNGDIVGEGNEIDAKLSALRFQNSLTPVHVPEYNSPALDASNNDSSSLDQTGRRRAFGGVNDIGSVERIDIDISGRIFEDRNGDGIASSTEPGLAGWMVFLDVNGNFHLDSDEFSAITQSDDSSTPLIVETGSFVLKGPTDIYRAVVVPPVGYSPTSFKVLLAKAEISLLRRFDSLTGLTELGGAAVEDLHVAAIDGDQIIVTGRTIGTMPDGFSGTGLFSVDRQGRPRALMTLAAGAASFNPADADSVDGGKASVVLRPNNGTGRPAGIYTVDLEPTITPAERLTLIADASTRVPGGDGNFDPTLFSSVSNEGDLVAFFTASAAGDNGGLYLGTGSEDIENLDDIEALLEPFAEINDIHGDGASLSFRVTGLRGESRIYVVSSSGELQKALDENTQIPGGAGTFLPFATQSRSVLTVSQGHVSFRGQGTDGQDGIYYGSNFLRNVADTTVDIPEGVGKFTSFGDTTAQGDSQSVFFVGYGSDGQAGIYVYYFQNAVPSEFVTRKVVDSSDLLDGKQFDLGHAGGPFTLGRNSVSGASVVFTAHFTDGSEAIYEATLQTIGVRDVFVDNRQSASNLDFGMVANVGSLSGSVFEDRDSNAFRGSDEKGIGGWSVYLDVNNNASFDTFEPFRLTDANGAYEFDDVEGNAMYHVRLVSQNGFSFTSPAASPGKVDIYLAAGEDRQGVALGVHRNDSATGVGTSGRLLGKLFEDRNSNRLQDAGEPNLGGQTVYLDLNNNSIRDAVEPSTVTSVTGDYQFANLSANQYVVRVDAGANLQQTTPLGNQLTAGNVLTGAQPRNVVSGDFDLDGDNDLAISLTSTNQVATLINNGNGVFSTTAIVAGLKAPEAIAAGQLNGLHGPDIVAANSYGQSISVLLSTGNSAGPLAAPMNYSTGGVPQGVAIAKLNGDASFDVAVAVQGFGNEINRILVFSNSASSSGVLTVSASLPLPSAPTSIVAADLDGDGDNDLAVILPDVNKIKIFRNTGSGFVADSELTLSTAPVFLTAADVTGDSKPELLTANSTNNTAGTLNVLRNTTAVGGSIAFAAPVAIAAGNKPTSVLAVDLDKDGNNDLVVGNNTTTTLAIYRNMGGGAFSAPESVGITTLNDPIALAVAAADVDKDANNTPDLIVVRGQNQLGGGFNGSVAVLRNSLTSGAQRASIVTGTETIPGLNFGLQSRNQAPTIDPLPTLNLQEDDGLQSVSLSGLGAGISENQAFSITASSNNLFLIANPITVVHTAGATTGSLRFQPIANQNGVALIMVTVRDVGSDGIAGNEDDAFSTQTLTVNVAAINDPPTVNADAFVVAAGASSYLFNVLSNDSIAPDIGETLSLVFVAPIASSIGSVQLENSQIRFTPAVGFVGTFTTQYFVSDGHGPAVAVDLTVTVTNGLLADIVDITPDPRSTPAGTVAVTFTQNVTGFNVADLRLTRGSAVVPLTGLTLVGSGNSYSIDLSSVTTKTGNYQLRLVAAGSGIVATSNEPLLTDASDTWDFLTTAWHNPTSSLNVDGALNGNGQAEIVPLDVLLIINELNFPTISDPATGALPLPGAFAPPPYLDVNNDGFVTAIDALLVINYLNGATASQSLLPAGEGEASSREQSAASDAALQALLLEDFDRRR